MLLIRTILRRSFFTAASLSTLLLLATLILWPVSYSKVLRAGYDTSIGVFLELSIIPGRLGLYYQAPLPLTDDGRQHLHFDTRELASDDLDWSYWGKTKPGYKTTFMGMMGSYFRGDAATADEVLFVIPFSYLALLFSVLPLLAFRSIRRRRKAARIGLCPKCNYDLRAQQAGAGGSLCPECGTPVASRR
jgi:hypothetical protein